MLYRLFPSRFESVSRNSGVLDTSKEEVKVLKLHGSIDWFDKSSHLEMERIHKEMGIQGAPQHIIFNGTTDWGLSKIVDGPRYDDDPLLNMYRVTNIEDLYKQNFLFLATPWILTPSTSKIVYANQLSDFWSGLGVSGGTNCAMAIIGYSLPIHDIYARQAIYSLVKNYQNVYWDEEIFGLRKTPLVLVDYRPTRESFEEFKRSYRFVDFDKAELFMDGFNMEAIDSIFA